MQPHKESVQLTRALYLNQRNASFYTCPLFLVYLLDSRATFPCLLSRKPFMPICFSKLANLLFRWQNRSCPWISSLPI